MRHGTRNTKQPDLHGQSLASQVQNHFRVLGFKTSSDPLKSEKPSLSAQAFIRQRLLTSQGSGFAPTIKRSSELLINSIMQKRS
ncbi:unnamed protein product [Brassica rapa]|uniref:Uncharacterized protein n=1 Tax=Brassica campestris TaxID=3711 RepID=A0A3P5ZJY0_BRACM|nr:unnamed protein product [Brassica rapa]VDC72428.1 unnamed protein product [Brassica rapa]